MARMVGAATRTVRRAQTTMAAIAHFPPRPKRRGRGAPPSPAAGVLLALSLPPFGWWPLAPAGFGLLAWRVTGLPWRARLGAGAAGGVGPFRAGVCGGAGGQTPGGGA